MSVPKSCIPTGADENLRYSHQDASLQGIPVTNIHGNLELILSGRLCINKIVAQFF